MQNKVFLIKNNAAIDAQILTKDKAVPGIIERFGLMPDKVAAIGDELVDIPLLSYPGLGLVGAPANAQQRVIDTVHQHANGFVSSKSQYDGFEQFYKHCQKQGIELIISDKDGVLKKGGDWSGAERFAALTQVMGNQGYPFVTVLTGSNYDDNLRFREAYGLDGRLVQNESVQEHPYLLMVEAGAIHVNVITGETRNYVKEINPDMLRKLKQEFEPAIKQKMDDLLEELGLAWTEKYEDQKGKVWYGKKQSMVSFNVPRQDKQGNPFRQTPQAEHYRDRVIGLMGAVAEEVDMPYEVL